LVVLVVDVNTVRKTSVVRIHFKKQIRTRPDDAIKDCGRVPRNLVVFTIKKNTETFASLGIFYEKGLLLNNNDSLCFKHTVSQNTDTGNIVTCFNVFNGFRECAGRTVINNFSFAGTYINYGSRTIQIDNSY